MVPFGNHYGIKSLRIISYLIEITNFSLFILFHYSSSSTLSTTFTQGQVFRLLHCLWTTGGSLGQAILCRADHSATQCQVQWLLIVHRVSSTLSLAFNTLHTVGPTCSFLVWFLAVPPFPLSTSDKFRAFVGILVEGGPSIVSNVGSQLYVVVLTSGELGPTSVFLMCPSLASLETWSTVSRAISEGMQ